MSQIHRVIVYEEGVAVCEDDLGRFLFERVNVKIVPLPEPKRCYLTGLNQKLQTQVLEMELEMA
jgi:hypothetical protein